MLFTTRLKLENIYLDEVLNGREVVMENLWRIFFVNALRFNSMVDSLLNFYGKSISHEFVMSVVRKCEKKSISIVRGLKSKICVPVSETEISWLFKDAFHRAMCRSSVRYGKRTYGSLKKRCQELKEEVVRSSSLDVNVMRHMTSLGELEAIPSRGYQRLK